MPRGDKRKTRLEKGGADFVGFGAFASSSTTTSRKETAASSSSLQWSPVYTGSDSNVATLLRRIPQKRDAATKARALVDLHAYFAAEHPSKPDQVDALLHFFWIFYKKLWYDDAALLREAALDCLLAAYLRVPKAFLSLLTETAEVAGMIWCSRGDPAAPVRTTAASLTERLMQPPQANNLHPNVKLFQEGLISLVRRMLRYERPRELHQALFGIQSSSSTTTTTTTQLSESERDQREERFVRLVGTAITGMETWIRQWIRPHPALFEEDFQQAFSDGLLWKPLGSSQRVLRRNAYALLATCCRDAPRLVYHSSNDLPKRLTQALSQEKEPQNIPPLLEVWLVFLVHFKGEKTTMWDNETLNASVVTNHLSKLLRKACHGATAQEWGPTLLPLLSTFPTTNDWHFPRQLLRNMWDGRTAARGRSDRRDILHAVVECCSFFLVRRRQDNNDTTTEVLLSKEGAQEVANLWLGALREFLDSTDPPSAARRADTVLVEGLARTLVQLDEASQNNRRPPCAMYGIQSWFWSDAMPATLLDAVGPTCEESNHRRFATLVQKVQAVRREKEPASSFGVPENHSSKWNPILRQVFHSTCRNYQEASSSIPTASAYALMIACLTYSGARYVFDTNEFGTLEHFVINDLLRWIVIHTSSQTSLPGSTTVDGGERFINYDFTLLRLCLLSSPPEGRQSLWEPILREIIAANCDLSMLSAGITILASPREESLSLIEMLQTCQALETFVLQVGVDAVDQYRATMEDAFIQEDPDQSGLKRDEYKAFARKVQLLLRSCLGLTPSISSPLVDCQIARKWVTLLSEDTNGSYPVTQDDHAELVNPLLMPLLDTVQQHGDIFEPEDTVNIFLASWRQGDKEWDQTSLALLDKNTTVAADMLTKASKELCTSLQTFIESSTEDAAEIVLACHLWSVRAHRLIKLNSAMKSSAQLGVPSLELVGLASTTIWETASATRSTSAIRHLYLCLVYLLEQMPDHHERLGYLLNSSESTNLILIILTALSNANVASAVADPQRRTDGRVRHVLHLLGGEELRQSSILETWCQSTVTKLRENMKSGGRESITNCFISVLSELIGVLFNKGQSEPDTIEAADIQEGQTVWYILDKEDTQKRIRAEVVKVHRDDFPRLYFTVRLDRGSDSQEKQTVSERLRLSPVSEEDKEEKAMRRRMGALIVEELVKPFSIVATRGNDDTSMRAAAECINTVICQCGLFDKGIGSTQYELFQWLSSLQTRITEQMGTEGNLSQSDMRTLSLAMGLGNIAPASTVNFRLVNFVPDDLVLALLEFYKKSDVTNPSIQQDRAVLDWLALANRELGNKKVLVEATELVYSLAARLLQSQATDSLSDSLFIMQAVGEAQLEAVRHVGLFEGFDDPNEQIVLFGLVKVFSAPLESRAMHSSPSGTLDLDGVSVTSEPVWVAPFEKVLETSLVHRRQIMKEAARASADDLITSLFQPSRRWIAFRLLHAAAGLTTPMKSEDEIVLSQSTEERLDSWQDGLEDEEKEELEDDVLTVSSWVPYSLMTEVEHWVEEKISQEEASTMGSMLTWLSLLLFIDGAASVDVINRGCFSSYVEKTKAVKCILDLALRYLNFEQNRSAKRSALVAPGDFNGKTALDLSSVAALVLFRTVEVFPSLTKQWWEEDCPKALSTPICQFIEKHVAPETLRRDLGRIKNATNLGALNVSGSLVSREVTATYMQDECQLSVSIIIPPAFPLRNVEVDGRKTLGVPEKRWKRWALQIRLMLNSQDGTLLDALLLWKQNVDKEFEGVEPCPVCYSVLSVKTHELPNLECKTCKNCFHSNCLYKWFHSSGKSQCVICQQSWSGTRMQ